jgi:hypothetical protein
MKTMKGAAPMKGSEGPRPAMAGGEVNWSWIKFFYKNRPISQVKTLKLKPCKKVMNTLTNNVEMIPSKLWMQQKNNESNWTPD